MDRSMQANPAVEAALEGLSRWRRLEWRLRSSSITRVAGLAGGLGMILTSLVFPRLPEGPVTLLKTAFRLPDMLSVLLLNDLLALNAALFFGGALELVRALVAPREEGQWELLLSKPVTPWQLVTARLGPILGWVAALGLVSSLLMWGLVYPWQAGASLGALAIVGSGIFTTVLSLVQLCVLVATLVYIREGFLALLVAAILWMMPMVGTVLLIYRPDVFVGQEHLYVAVFPVNFLWPDLRGGLLLGCLVPLLGLAALSLAVARRGFGRVE